MKPLLIGLSGKSGSGKTTAANYLTEEHGYHQFAFADALKDVVVRAFDLQEEQLYGDLKEVVDPRWGKSPRWLMQYLGTEVLRNNWPDIWIRHLRRAMMDFLRVNGAHSIVVTDVRFRDEAEALKRLTGVIWRLERPGAPAVSNGIEGHISETGLDDDPIWDALIVANVKTDLFEKLDILLNHSH